LVLDGLDDDDRVVDDEPDREDQPEERERVDREPRSGKTANVPISETGTATSGMSVARQFWRNRKTTRRTRSIASPSVMTISRMPSVTGAVVSTETA